MSSHFLLSNDDDIDGCIKVITSKKLQVKMTVEKDDVKAVFMLTNLWFCCSWVVNEVVV